MWNFGNMIPKVTTQNFGKDHEYGTADFARFGGTVDLDGPRQPRGVGQVPGANFAVTTIPVKRGPAASRQGPCWTPAHH